MSKLNIPKGLSNWLNGKGPESPVVISSRIRLARNLSDFKFTNRAKPEELRNVLDLTRNASRKTKALKENNVFVLSDISWINRQILMERHLISHEQTKADNFRGLIVDGSETSSIMVNEEDHIRLSSFSSGLNLTKIWEQINGIDDELGEHLNYAYHPVWGYLTACPTNCGTGMRASSLSQLPALSLMDEINQILQDLTKVGLTTRGFYGEGTKIIGDMFQISNTTTMGKSETEIINHLEKVLKKIVNYEASARDKLNSAPYRVRTEDLIYRAFATINSARILSFEETMLMVSRVKLGIQMGLKLPVDVTCLNELIITAQPAHIQNTVKKELPPHERNIKRATLVRRLLNK